MELYHIFLLEKVVINKMLEAGDIEKGTHLIPLL